MPASGGVAYARETMTTVLLVEDDDRISEPLIRVLRAESFDVVHVAAGQPALQAIAEWPGRTSCCST